MKYAFAGCILVASTFAVSGDGSPDQRALINGRVYIRRPGPESAEPATPEEWRELFTRCLRANRDELLDAMRDILSGHAGGAAP
jgi:hypothetical protein